ncbi:hypothetical protein HQ576_19655 [bacterium]|nr:hypothetical protein [bacterium]
MEYALVGKLLVEAVTAAGVLTAVLLFLKDRRVTRAADLRDRAAERSSLYKLMDNAVAHNTAATEANTRQQAAGAQALGTLAGSIDGLGDRLASRPCLFEHSHADG